MSEQQTLGFDYDQPTKEKSGKVVCLGITFENEEKRRKYFTEKLREKLQDPELRKIEGFPIGSDEDILALSDPPYYTACPNPWIADFIKEWESQKPEKPADYKYHREPFAADVKEGKNDPIYNAHSYHTKVPHKAIMRYILHYTEPGDIVFDGFCGTGMTGVAAQMCGDRKTVESLGYQVQSDGTIMQQETDEDGKTRWVPFSKLGVRKAVLNDLSPAATFIAYNYNTPVDVKAFEKEAKRILKEVEEECGWMYATVHKEPRINTDEHRWKDRLIRVNPCPSVVEDNPDLRFGKINYTVWSDVFICPECAGEVVFWEAAVDKEAGKVLDEFPCPYCSAKLTKRSMDRAWVTKYDSAIKETIRQAKQVPVLINYSVNGKRSEKKPDEFDFALIEKIEKSEIPYWFPTNKIPKGDKTGEPIRIGITHVHHFYTRRNLWVLAVVLKKAYEIKNARLITWITASMIRTTKMYKFTLDRKMGTVSGTLYIPSLWTENGAFKLLAYKIGDMKKAGSSFIENPTFCASFEKTIIPESNLDYIFVDPPFGSNLNYSELNFLWESWLRIWTNNKPEAIENSVQGKGPREYRQLMTACFKEAHRVLKPGYWMTVEFSNTKASVWNSIQTALNDAGFIIANVSALDKKQGSFNAVTNTTSVKQDLVISAYKPNGGFEKRFQEEATTEEGVWDFVRTHLDYLPVIKSKGALLEMVPERDPRILFDQMVAYYVRKGYFVPISSQEFQAGLSQRFIERDGMYFLPEQAAEYDRKKMTKQVFQATFFVSDEASAIQWLRQLLKEKPQTFQDINPLFMQELSGWSKNEQQLDLRELLNQNFLCYNGKEKVPSQIHSYLSSNWPEMRNLEKDDPRLVKKAKDRWYVPDPNKAGDLEKLRERALLKEFDEYKQAKKKLKVFRFEAVRAGFKKAWHERDYGTIIDVAEKIPNNVLEEDPKLLMWYDQAVTRKGDE
ncbi:Adenine specific DNA methylase Mod [Methanosarcina siciliae HI350]|uniref:Adenine specific DNA methylase Mod n=1 Tax=Methanosarcina siciliae HI350 TaxID=1434119 RepID=A0A0E3PDN6_9EURY|nr:DNA methyltransferase [Methanosarcina siciliae]AKB32608.1 Adenine specific DNA methylase Mod [Methanosarcina siciliae HI350]